MTDNELNERLAKAVGFTHLPYRKDAKGKVNDNCWIEPWYSTQMLGHWSFNPPDFTSSMDACIKWIWPHFWIIEMDTVDGIFYRFKLSHPENPNSPIAGKLTENPATAFCLAAIKYFEEVSK